MRTETIVDEMSTQEYTILPVCMALECEGGTCSGPIWSSSWPME